ncbi:L,D-transpeptidase family protein [Rhizobium laguerreae]|nr:L,D-transpeptidase family protein [Rhizobium laguerreae]
MRKPFIVLAAVIISLFAYTKLMARVGSGSPPPDVPLEQQADLIRVYKAERRMVPLKGDTPISTYRISLGRAADEGPKQREGDEKTPEGRYEIDWRNSKSMAHLLRRPY